MNQIQSLLLAVIKVQHHLLSKEGPNFDLILETIGSGVRATHGALFTLEGKLTDGGAYTWGEARQPEATIEYINCHYAQLLDNRPVVEERLLLLPIGVEATLWGVLVWEKETWEEETIGILQDLAQAVAQTIARRLREARTNDSLKQEVKLFAVARRLRHSLQTEQILATATTEIRELCGCDRVLIYRLEGAKGSSLVQKSIRPGVPEGNISMNVANFVTDLSEREHILRPRIVDNIDRAGVSPAIHKLFARAGVKAFLSVPVTIDGMLWGWLVLHYYDRPHYWNSREVYIIKHLSEQLGVAVHQAQLYESTYQQQQRYYILNQIGTAIRSSTELNTILILVAQEICQLCNLQSVLFWQYKRDGEIWHNILNYSCQEEDCQNPSRSAPLKLEPDPWQEKDTWGFPLILRSELWGVMEVSRRPGDGVVIDGDLMALVTNQLVVAIQRYQLHRHNEMQNLREQAFNRLMRQLLGGSSLSDFFTHGVTELQYGLRAERIYIGRYLDETTWHLQWGYIAEGGRIECLSIELCNIRPDISEALGKGEVLHLDYIHSLAANFTLEPGALYLPLQFQHQVWGCLIIVKGKKRWLVEELQLAEGIADIVAIAIYQQGLRETEQAQRQELSLQNLHLEAALQAAENAKAAQNRFLANMSHEIRTPMNGVIGMAELLAETNLSPQQEQFVETIGICARNLLTLINDILDFSKLEAGQTQLETVPFKIQTCIEEACHLIAVKCHEKNIEVFPCLDPNLPPEVEGDPTRLQQVLNNLANNAAKFTDRGIINIKAELLAQNGEEAIVCFAVEDTGIGIRSQDLSRLFKPFQQVDASTTRRYGGTGLGLSICQQLVELMGGHISVESEFGKGSEFKFTLPFRISRQPSTPPADLGAMKVLVVSDQQATTKVIETYVKPWNVVLDSARDGTFALERLRSGHYDRVLLDMQMSPISGEILAQYIRHDRELAHLKVTLMTLSTHRPADGSLFDHLLIKPVTSDRLLQSLRLDRAQTNSTPITFDRSIKLLLVEDNIVNQTLALNQLKKLGLSADLAPNGEEAIVLIKNNTYSLVLMDCQMPIMDGYTTAQEIRLLEAQAVLPGKLPIIAMTASALESDREACLAAGMNDFISKPVTKSKLAEVLQKWLTTDREPSLGSIANPPCP